MPNASKDVHGIVGGKYTGSVRSERQQTRFSVSTVAAGRSNPLDTHMYVYYVACGQIILHSMSTCLHLSTLHTLTNLVFTLHGRYYYLHSAREELRFKKVNYLLKVTQLVTGGRKVQSLSPQTLKFILLLF